MFCGKCIRLGFRYFQAAFSKLLVQCSEGTKSTNPTLTEVSIRFPKGHPQLHIHVFINPFKVCKWKVLSKCKVQYVRLAYLILLSMNLTEI